MSENVFFLTEPKNRKITFAWIFGSADLTNSSLLVLKLQRLQ